MEYEAAITVLSVRLIWDTLLETVVSLEDECTNLAGFDLRREGGVTVVG